MTCFHGQNDVQGPRRPRLSSFFGQEAESSVAAGVARACQDGEGVSLAGQWSSRFCRGASMRTDVACRGASWWPGENFFSRVPRSLFPLAREDRPARKIFCHGLSAPRPSMFGHGFMVDTHRGRFGDRQPENHPARTTLPQASVWQVTSLVSDLVSVVSCFSSGRRPGANLRWRWPFHRSPVPA